MGTRMSTAVASSQGKAPYARCVAIRKIASSFAAPFLGDTGSLLVAQIKHWFRTTLMHSSDARTYAR